MFSPLISWILPFSSSSSSSSDSVDEEEEQQQSLDTYDDELDHENDNVAEDQNDDHFLSSCNVDDDDDSIPVALAIPNPSPTAVTVAFPTVEEGNAVTTATTIVSRRPKRKSIERITDYSVVGKQNQRLWTKQDEMELLKGYLDYMKNERGGTTTTTTTLQNDVALLYDHVRPKLKVDFNKNQLVEKLRRLKRKHKVCMDKVKLLASGPPTFKNLQDKAIFEISHKIWGNDKDQFGNLDDHGIGNGNIAVKNEQVENDCDDLDNKAPKRLRTCNDHDHNDGDNGISIQGLIEETMRSCFSPLLKEVLDDPQGGSEEAKVTQPPLCCGELKDRKILELEVYLNRLELLQGQIKDRLEELRSG